MDMDSCVNVQVNDIMKLKESTRKLLFLLEDIQSKTQSKDLNHRAMDKQISSSHSTSTMNTLYSVTDKIGENAFKKLELQARHLDAIYVNDEDDDCSGYKRLTRKCHCLNREEFNDFVIHFNEDVKYFTNNIGEIIKNIRILKKFLYIGGGYTKNALLFLNEALSDAKHSEQIDIINGCSHADICNVFEDHCIVAVCIRMSHKFETYSDVVTQNLTARFLHNLAQVEEGRRYLNYSTKIENDIKKVLRKKASKLEFDTLESLNAVLNLLHKSINEHANVTYYCRPQDKGMSRNVINVIMQYRHYMTIDELLQHLNLLNSLSSKECGKTEARSNFMVLLKLFKSLLIEFDNSEMNIVLINILNNIISASVHLSNDKMQEEIVDCTFTELEKNITQDLPKTCTKENNKFSKSFKVALTSHAHHDLGFSRKQHKSKEKSNTVIVVPLEKKKMR